MRGHVDNLHEVNLADLIARYYQGTKAPFAAAIIDFSDDPSLDLLLRSHLLSEVTSQTQIAARDAIDDLLAFYSILEIGILCGALAERLPHALAASARRHLTRPYVRRYYEKFYPLFLPQLFLRRLHGKPVGATSSAVGYFVSFLEINEALIPDPVETFLWFLDDGYLGDAGLEDILQVLNKPERFTKRMLRPTAEQTDVDNALHGMIQFFGFCVNLDKLLQNAPDALLQSACWHFHGYWFQQVGGQVHGVISAAIEQYREWVPSPEDTANQEDLAAIKATHASMDRFHRALQRLTSAVYRAAIEKLLLSQTSTMVRATKRTPYRIMSNDPLSQKKQSTGYVTQQLLDA
ncbi:MAG TPA: hypothetical protein VH188_03895 [Chthoniobacterales bacterium]|jgi:hypothetical protein|nr:hypothetical protein [Chthoniobacterales bacterium]